MCNNIQVLFTYSCFTSSLSFFIVFLQYVVWIVVEWTAQHSAYTPLHIFLHMAQHPLHMLLTLFFTFLHSSYSFPSLFTLLNIFPSFFPSLPSFFSSFLSFLFHSHALISAKPKNSIKKPTLSSGKPIDFLSFLLFSLFLFKS